MIDFIQPFKHARPSTWRRVWSSARMILQGASLAPLASSSCHFEDLDASSKCGPRDPGGIELLELPTAHYRSLPTPSLTLGSFGERQESICSDHESTSTAILQARDQPA